MAIDFPDSPTVDQQYSVGDRTWTWNGTYWQLSQTSSTFTASDTAPVGPSAGDIWFESDTGQTFVYYDQSWVEIGAATDLSDILSDADADTSIQVEASSDEDVIRFRTAGTERLQLTSDGHLIPQANVTYDLGSASNRFRDLYLSGSSIDLGGVEISSDGTSLTMPPVSNISGDFTVGTDVLHVDHANSFVGIGTTTPSQTLDVRSANDNTSVFQHTTNGSDARIELRAPEAGGTSRAGQVFFDPDANFVGFRNGNINAMGVDSSGNVGIGTTAPEKPLHVVIGSKSGGSYGSTHYFLVDSDGDSGLGVYSGESSEGYIRFGDASNGAAGGFRYDHSVDELYIRSGGSDHMTFDSSGNIGINTAPSTNILSINGTANPGTNGDVYIGSSSIPLNLYTTTTSTAVSGWKLYSNVTGTEVLQALVRANGDFESRTNSYGATSDAAIKQDIVDAPSQWDDIKAVQLRKYRLIDDVAQNGDDALVQLGVVAQELEAAGMGGLVVDDDPDNDKPYKSVKYSVLLLKALGALQEAMARIEALEAN